MHTPISSSRWLRFHEAAAEGWAIFLDAITYWPLWPYYRVRYFIAQAIARARWTYFPSTLEACDVCGAPAQWDYTSEKYPQHYCDEHVPRGCSCQVIGDIPYHYEAGPRDEDGEETIRTVFECDGEPEQYRDDQGRLLPCCDFDFSPWGWKKDSSG